MPPFANSTSGCRDLQQGCLLAKDRTLHEMGTPGIETTSYGWQYYANDFEGMGHTKWVGTQHVGARLAVQLTHAATAVRITVLTSAGGAHWAPNETHPERRAPMGMAEPSLFTHHQS